MHKKGRLKRNFTPSRRYNIDRYRVNRPERLDKSMFFLFILATIVAIIFLYAYSPITSNVVLTSILDKPNYNANEKITGIVSLQMQEGDILPENAKISIIVKGNSTVKCATRYLCPVSGEIEWYKVNTTGECYLKNADPEKICCQQNPLNCKQVILNSGFENSLNNWVFSKAGNQYPTAAQEELVLENWDGSINYSSKTAALSTENISSNGSAFLTQNFATPITVESLILNKPNLVVSDLKYSVKDNYYILYNITVCNEGYGKTTSSFYVKMTEAEEGTSRTLNRSYKITQNLTEGQCAINQISSPPTFTNFTVKAIADPITATKPFGDINEINELDNFKNITIRNYYPKNLYFESYSASYNSTTDIQHINQINYTIKICNDYNASLGPFNVSVYSPTSSSNVTGEPNIQTSPSFYIQFGAITPKTCTTHSAIYSLNTNIATISFANFPTNPPLANGTYSYWVWIDKENVTKDFPEDNKRGGEFRVGRALPGHEEEFAYSPLEQEEQEENILFFDSTPGFGSEENFSLGWMAYSNLDYNVGCAFEIVVKGNHSTTQRTLHYYYVISDICNAPENTANDKYFVQTYNASSDALIDIYTNLYSNWMSAFPDGAQDRLTGVYLASHGKKIEYDSYVQTVFFDNIRLNRKSELEPLSSSEMSCTAKSKQCCLEGSGSGVYYGQQLSCSEGYECWEKCSQKEFTLKEFIAASTTSSKYNKTEGDCQMQTSSGQAQLYDYCGEYTGCTNCVGEGYTACIDTSSTSSSQCKNWNNIYSLNISRLQPSLYAPSSNGTHSVIVLFTYKTTTSNGIPGEILNLSITEVPLIVGTGEEPPVSTCYDTDYVNCTGTWSECDINNQKTRNATCYYSGTQSCPSTRYIVQNENCYTPQNYTTCASSDWGCGEWSECEGGNQIRSCSLYSSSCDPTLPGSFVPSEQQACEEPEPDPTKKYLTYVVIGLVVLAVIALVIKFLVSKGLKGEIEYAPAGSATAEREREKTERAEKKEDYPELISYIKDALAAGMSPSEIRIKLQEAGWPKNIVESVFKKFE